jgi:uncharacterized protein DUF2442/uncharacterized protein DUF4160
MYYDESHHRGRPHFHAHYGDVEASVDIESGVVIAGELPPRALPQASTMSSMRSTPLLIDAIPGDGYSVRVSFEDGLIADVDLSYLLDYGGVFEPLRDLEYFRQLRADVEAGTIVWPNEADIAPETLYARAKRRAAATA